MGIRVLITWFLKKLISDWFALIVPSLTLLVWYAGALLSGIYGPYHPEWLPDYVNVLSVYSAPFYEPAGLSYSLIMLHFIWFMILIITVFLGEECAKSYLPYMGRRRLLKTILACVLGFPMCFFAAIKFNGKSFYFGSFFYEYEFFFLLAVALAWWAAFVVLVVTQRLRLLIYGVNENDSLNTPE